MLSRRSPLWSSCGLAALFLLLLVSLDVPADAAAVSSRTKRRWSSSSSSDSLLAFSSSASRSPITSIAHLRSVVSPSASNLPGCVLFLNATSATAAGCSSKPRRLRQDPPPTLPLVGGLPEKGRGKGKDGNDARGGGDVVAVLSAGDDAAALDLLVRGGNSSSDELSSRGVAGLVALPGPPPEGDWSPDDANPQVREREREKNGGIIFVFLLHAKRRPPPPPKNSQPRAKCSRKTKKTKQQSEYCPYQIPANFSWVRGARGLLRAPLPVPILAPYGDFAAVVAEAAGAKVDPKDKERKTPPPPLRLAALDDAMEASRSGARNSSHCLAQGTCGPIGGYSVWAALPAMPPPPSPEQEGPAAAGRAPTSPPPPVGDGLGPPPPPPPVPPPPPSPPPRPRPDPASKLLRDRPDRRPRRGGGLQAAPPRRLRGGRGPLGARRVARRGGGLGNATRFSSTAEGGDVRWRGERRPSPPAPLPRQDPLCGSGGGALGLPGLEEAAVGGRDRKEERRRAGTASSGGGEKEEERRRRRRRRRGGGFPLSDVSWLIELGAVGDAPSLR